MPQTGPRAGSGRARTVAMWTFLTVASCGFALTAASLAGGPEAAFGWGLAVMAFSALAFLYVLYWSALTLPRPVRSLHGAAPVPVGAPIADVARRALEGAGAAPASPKEPEDLVEFTLERPPEAAPARGPSEGAWPRVTEDQWRRQRASKQAAGEFELPPAFQRRKEFTADLPIVRSIFEDEPEEPVPAEREGKTRGQCGACKTYLWAPKQRPLRLRCPKCGKVALLQA